MIAVIYVLGTFFLALITNSMLLQANAVYIGSYIHRADWILFLIYALLYGAGKTYIVVWEDIAISRKKNGIGLFLYEKLFFPAAWLYLIKCKLPFSSIENQPYLLASVVMLFILLGDWMGIIKRVVRYWYPGVSELEKGKLFLTFPPQSRVDMLPLDLYFNGIMAVIIYRQIFT